jgi:translation initiation factor 2B subunit (eIF-2B alpha/beta/delta family)
VAYESFKYRPAELGAVELEEMAPIELGVPSDVPVEVRNIYFDITPPQWVTGWIDEHGYRPYQEWDGT